MLVFEAVVVEANDKIPVSVLPSLVYIVFEGNMVISHRFLVSTR